MAVVIVPKFTRAQIKERMVQEKQRLYEVVLLNLKRVGELFVKSAREQDTYKDRTGNLRSSIGYVILYNGQQMFESFKSAGGPLGVGKAKEVIEEVKTKYPRGFVLIGVAGMDYAAAVEAKGYDVISASSIEAATGLRVAINRISKKLAA